MIVMEVMDRLMPSCKMFALERRRWRGPALAQCCLVIDGKVSKLTICICRYSALGPARSSRP
jgi:hypothetical protein